MENIAITGAGGYIGTCLIKYLENADWCKTIFGTDINEPGQDFSKLNFIKKDIRDHSLLNFFKQQNIDTLVHLAFVVDPIHDDNEMYDINVNGTLNVLNICKELKIPHVIMASSGTAYGAWPDNPCPINEDDPIRLYPPSFNYAHHKGLNENLFKEFMIQNPDIIFNIIRPCIVYGPNTDNYLSRFLKLLPFVPLISGQNPDMQFVHEDDVARFFSLLIEKKVPGPFNIAGDGVIKFSEVGKMAEKKSIKVPYWLIYKIIQLGWALNIIFESPPGITNYLAYPWVMDISRAKRLLGWIPQYTSQETLQVLLDTHEVPRGKK